MSGSKVDAKVVLLGKEFGGKTSLVERFLHNRFSGDLPYQNTIGAAYGAKRVEIGGKKVVLGIWDTAGSERYQAMSRIYYRNAWAALICYDLTDGSSWEKAKFWASEVKQQEPLARIYFVGTKEDIIAEDGNRLQVNQRQVEVTAREVAEGGSFHTSSRTGDGVVELFSQVAADFLTSAKHGPVVGSAEQLSLGNGSPASSLSVKPRCQC